jgi:hypothetical protein
MMMMLSSQLTDEIDLNQIDKYLVYPDNSPKTTHGMWLTEHAMDSAEKAKEKTKLLNSIVRNDAHWIMLDWKKTMHDYLDAC